MKEKVWKFGLVFLALGWGFGSLGLVWAQSQPLLAPASASPQLARRSWNQDFSLTQSSSARLDAIKAVFQGKHPRAAKALRAAFLQEPHASIRAWMVRAEDHASPGHLKFLAAALKDSDVFVREAAVVALGESGKPQAVSDLAALLSSETDPGARMTVCFWLGQLGGSQAVSALSQVLSSDKDPNIRLQAAQSLKKIGTGAALSALSQAAHDPNSRVREAAR